MSTFWKQENGDWLNKVERKLKSKSIGIETNRNWGSFHTQLQQSSGKQEHNKRLRSGRLVESPQWAVGLLDPFPWAHTVTISPFSTEVWKLSLWKGSVLQAPNLGTPSTAEKWEWGVILNTEDQMKVHALSGETLVLFLHTDLRKLTASMNHLAEDELVLLWGNCPAQRKRLLSSFFARALCSWSPSNWVSAGPKWVSQSAEEPRLLVLSTLHVTWRAFNQYPNLSLGSTYPGFSTLSRGRFSSKFAQSCPTLCDPMDCSLPGSSVISFLLFSRNIAF